MRRPVLFTLVAVILLLVVATSIMFVRYRKSSADYVDMKLREETARTGYAEAFSAVTEIQDSLTALALGDTAVRMLSRNLNDEQKPTAMQRREALDRIAYLGASIQRSKEKLARLEASLAKSGLKVASLQNMIGSLKQSLAYKEAIVATLAGRVDSLQTRVGGLETEVQQGAETIRAREQTIAETQRELATIYYIVGTKKALINAGVLEAKGGILELGKTLQLSGHYTESLFTPMDTDRESVIPTAAARVQVMSAQPKSSYEVRTVDGRAEIHILDAKEFRKVKHAVLMTR